MPPATQIPHYPSIASPPATDHRSSYRTHATWAVTVIGSTVALLSTVSSRKRNVECSGLEFDCDPGIATFLAALFVVPTALLTLLVGHAIISSFGTGLR